MINLSKDRKRLLYSRSGDWLEVKILDSSYNTFHRAKVNVNDSKAMCRLLKDLRDLGIDFSKYLKDIDLEGL